MPFRETGSWFLLAAATSMCLASSSRLPVRGTSSQETLERRERQLWTVAVHDSNFAPMSRTAARSACEAAQPPEELATPEPLLDKPVSTTRVTVSFIIGTDGRVHSPLILESLGPSEDRIVLDAVRNWRYRPATCNGVPTEAEGKIAFSSR